MSTQTRLVIIIIANNMKTLDNIFFCVPDSIFQKIPSKRIWNVQKKNIKHLQFIFLFAYLRYTCDAYPNYFICVYSFDVISVNFPFYLLKRILFRLIKMLEAATTTTIAVATAALFSVLSDSTLFIIQRDLPTLTQMFSISQQKWKKKKAKIGSRFIGINLHNFWFWVQLNAMTCS